MSTEEILSALKELKSGNMDAFERFYEQTKRTTFFGAYAILKDQARSEDVLQEVYLKFLDMVKEVDESRSVVALLATMARNRALNLYEKEKRHLELKEEFNSLPSEERHFAGDLFERMKDLLDDEEYEIVILHAVDDMKHREIAELMHLPLGTVTWKYNNAVQKLKKGLGDRT